MIGGRPGADADRTVGDKGALDRLIDGVAWLSRLGGLTAVLYVAVFHAETSPIILSFGILIWLLGFHWCYALVKRTLRRYPSSPLGQAWVSLFGERA